MVVNWLTPIIDYYLDDQEKKGSDDFINAL